MAAQVNVTKHVARIRTAEEAGELTPELLYEELFGYIRSKYLLDPEDCRSERMNDLAQDSLAKTLRVAPELVADLDNIKTCGSASSTTAKIVLLYTAIQRDLEIRIPAEKTAYVDTVRDLSDLVWNVMESEKGDHSR